jgi:hypothetical protein
MESAAPVDAVAAPSTPTTPRKALQYAAFYPEAIPLHQVTFQPHYTSAGHLVFNAYYTGAGIPTQELRILLREPVFSIKEFASEENDSKFVYKAIFHCDADEEGDSPAAVAERRAFVAVLHDLQTLSLSAVQAAYPESNLDTKAILNKHNEIYAKLEGKRTKELITLYQDLDKSKKEVCVRVAYAYALPTIHNRVLQVGLSLNLTWPHSIIKLKTPRKQPQTVLAPRKKRKTAATPPTPVESPPPTAEELQEALDSLTAPPTPLHVDAPEVIPLPDSEDELDMSPCPPSPLSQLYRLDDLTCPCSVCRPPAPLKLTPKWGLNLLRLFDAAGVLTQPEEADY